MHYLWITLGVAIAAVVVALPIVAIILVSLASLHEESAHSLSGEAPGAADRIARRLLGFKTTHIGALAPSQRPVSRSSRNTEVRFVHARRSVSDPGEYPADRQSQQDPIRLGERQGAGV